MITRLSLKESAEQWAKTIIRQSSFSNDRADYPKLSDAEYANFRAAETRGMGAGTLFRSSSPIDPALNRSAEADAALFEAQVRTVVNMADSEETMRQYADYSLTHYAACDVLALDMGTDFADADFRQKLTEGLRFIASHDGPYLIHCKEGKDRRRRMRRSRPGISRPFWPVPSASPRSGTGTPICGPSRRRISRAAG